MILREITRNYEQMEKKEKHNGNIIETASPKGLAVLLFI
jgi:hypothetical protein